MPSWEVLLYSGPQANPIYWQAQSDLPRAYNKQLNLKIDDPNTFTFSLNGKDPDTKMIQELATDVVVKRDGFSLFRGRITTTSDDLSQTTHVVNVMAHDYREILKRRFLYDGDSILTHASVTLVEQEEIAWRLIEATQGRNNGTLGITRGTGQTTGRQRNREYEPGQNIYELLKQLSEVIDGFDWEIDPSLVFRLYYPKGGTNVNFALNYGSNVTTITRDVDPKDYLNAGRVTGGEPVGGGSAPTPETRESFPVSRGLAIQGRWEKQLGDQNWITQDAVREHADSLIEGDQIIIPTYTATLKPNVWAGPEEVRVGNKIRLTVQSGRLNVDTEIRIINMSIDFDNAEKITMQLGSQNPGDKWLKSNAKILHELSTLQRR